MKKLVVAISLLALPAGAVDLNEARLASLATSAMAQIVQIPAVGGGVAVGDNNTWTGTNIFTTATTFGSAAAAANSFVSANNAWVFEGATADGFETTVTITDPDVDSTFTIGYSPDGNPWIGATAGDSATSAEVDNVLIGSAAGTAMTGTSTDNVAIGDNAGDSITSGDRNTIVGGDADGVAAGTDQTAIGNLAVVFANGGIAIGSGAENSDGVSIGTAAGDASAAADVDNVFIGTNAGTAANATSTDNTCVGDGACSATTTGDNNVFIGSASDTSTAADSGQVAVGYLSVSHSAESVAVGGGAEASGGGIAIGYQAGDGQDAGSIDNVLIGHSAGGGILGGADDGTDNVCVGDAGCVALTTGDQNTILGTQSAATLATGADNVVLGYSADVVDAAGANAVVVGSGAKAEDNSVSIGYQAGASLTTGGDQNTFVGYQAGTAQNNAVSDQNTCVGYQACSGAVSVDRMTAIGDQAGISLTTGDTGVYIGADSDNTGNGALSVAVGVLAIAHGGTNVVVGAQAEAGVGGVTVGYAAGDAQAAADADNVLVGYTAGTALNGTATDNTYVGDSSGDAATTGDRNVLYGANTDLGTATDSDVTVVGESMVGKASDSILVGFGGQEYMYVHGAGKVITDNTATSIVDISVADDTAGGATIEYTVTAVEADEYQSERGAVYMAWENDSGTESCAIGEIGTTVLAGGGTMGVTNACTVGLTDEVRWTFTADSSLGAPATTVTLYWSIRVDGPATTISPQ